VELTVIDRYRREKEVLEEEREVIRERMEALDINRTEAGTWIKLQYSLMINRMTIEIGKKKDEIAFEEAKRQIVRRRRGAWKHERAGGGAAGGDQPAEGAGRMPDDLRREKAKHEQTSERTGTGEGRGAVLENPGRVCQGDPEDAPGDGEVVEEILRARLRERNESRLKQWQRDVMEKGCAEEALKV